MAKQQTGLAAFARKPSPAPTEAGDQKPSSPAKKRNRGQGDMVALTIRLPKADWMRLHQLALSEGASLQDLALEGLSKVFAAKGLPKLDTN